MKTNIKHILIFALLPLSLAFGQGVEKELKFELKSTTQSTVNQERLFKPLIDWNGQIVGKFGFSLLDDNARYIISKNNTGSVEIPALSCFYYSSSLGKIMMFGSNPIMNCVSTEMTLKVYNTLGQSLGTYPEVLKAPYSAHMSDAGDIYVSGRLHIPDSILVLRKLKSTFAKVWELSFKDAVLESIKTSPDGKYVLAVFDYYREDARHTVLINATSGKILSDFVDMNTIECIEFNGNEVILAGARNVKCYLIEDEKGLVLNRAVKIPINTVAREFSISFNGTRTIMAVAHCSDKSSSDSQISFFDLKTFRLLGKIDLPGDRTYRRYRVLNFTSENAFTITLNDKTENYEYTY